MIGTGPGARYVRVRRWTAVLHYKRVIGFLVGNSGIWCAAARRLRVPVIRTTVMR